MEQPPIHYPRLDNLIIFLDEAALLLSIILKGEDIYMTAVLNGVKCD